MWWNGSHASLRGWWGKPRGSSILLIRIRSIGEMADAQVLGTCVLHGRESSILSSITCGVIAQLAEAPDLKSGCSEFESQWPQCSS
jgi:hypothetical protein